jgi:hypothetical protein
MEKNNRPTTSEQDNDKFSSLEFILGILITAFDDVATVCSLTARLSLCMGRFVVYRTGYHSQGILDVAQKTVHGNFPASN